MVGDGAQWGSEYNKSLHNTVNSGSPENRNRCSKNRNRGEFPFLIVAMNIYKVIIYIISCVFSFSLILIWHDHCVLPFRTSHTRKEEGVMCGLAVNIRREEGLASIHLTGYLSATASEMLKDLLAEVNGAERWD